VRHAGGYAELNGRYQRLRSELDAAYARPVWNSARIDEIAAQMAEVERALASSNRKGGLAGSWHDASTHERATPMDS
jgi:hypothetical protein